jgi:hypothetical protein
MRRIVLASSSQTCAHPSLSLVGERRDLIPSRDRWAQCHHLSASC